MSTYAPLVIISTLWSSALIGRLFGRRHQRAAVAVQRLAAAAVTGIGVALAVRSTGLPDDALLTVDRLGVGIAVFVTAMLTVVGSFASRSLAADPRADRFFTAANLLTGATVLLALANRPWLVAVAWIAVSLSTVALIAYDGRSQARAAARRAARVFLVGDIAVVAGCVLVTAATPGATNVWSTAATSGSWLTLAGVAVLVGALARSAQVPFSGWLAASVAAPTPVSAMLHAGVVNGSAVLLIRAHPLFAASAVLTTLSVSMAVIGIVVGMSVGRTRPDVKTGLAWTTVAQMGFMILQCALGLVGPAVVHLMAHGLFKSSLFLGASGGLDGAGKHRHPTRTRPTPGVVVASAATAAGIVAVGLVIIRPDFLHHAAGIVPVTFATLTVAFGLLQWWSRTAAASLPARLLPVPVTAVAFTALTWLSSTVDRWLGPSLGTEQPIGAAWFAGAATVVVLGVALGGGAASRLAPRVARRAWMVIAAATAPTTGSLRRPLVADGSAGHRRTTSIADPARRSRIRSTIAQAAADVAPSWPLERFVATNPLLASEHLPIEEAVERAARQLGVRAEFDEATYRHWHAEGRISTAALREAAEEFLEVDHTGPDDHREAVDRLVAELLHAAPYDLPGQQPVLASEWHDHAAGTRWAASVDELASWWCAAYLSDHPAAPMPDRDRGLYAAWRSVVAADPRPDRAIGTAFADLLGALPERSDDAVMLLLVELGVDRPDHAAYLARHLHRQLGWAAALVRTSGVDGDDLIDHLAIRLAFEAAFLAGSASRRLATRAAAANRGGQVSEAAPARLAVWREAYERAYRQDLLSSLRPTAPHTTTDVGDRPAAQIVACIDPRSEGLRRHLEALGHYETIGFAGFFGLPITVTDLDADAPVASCPVIVDAQASVIETATTGGDLRRDRLHAVHAVHDAFATAKRSAAAPFALAETLGWISGATTAARTLAPTVTAAATAHVRRALVPDATTSIVPAAEHWWTAEQQISVAASILATTGIHRNAARLVVLCGHMSRHVNNLHRAALDCGACGGRGGGNNARAAANLLNDPVVRSGLLAHGFTLPADTHFVAAEHDTTSDQVRVLDRDLVPTSHRAGLASLEIDLATAGTRLAAERGATLPSTVGAIVGPRPSRVQRRGSDWAQVVPEWGLVANAALVIGPRSLTASVDLQRRVFLHSYDAAHDPDGSVLAGIMAGPLLVAHWISSQYRLSTIDPDRLGAGTKTAHNLVGGVGVIEGAGGDLRMGLPIESVRAAGGDVHEAMRLLVVVDADSGLVDDVLRNTPDVARLVDNGWLRLAARSEAASEVHGPWVLRSRRGGWMPWPPPAAPQESIRVPAGVAAPG